MDIADTEGLDKKIEQALRDDTKKIVVLDDDPTGIQTVHGITLYTSYEEEDIDDIFSSSSRLSFILTNTRAMGPAKAEDLNRIILRRIIKASDRTGVDFEIISRSDSTLRGHYPVETDVLRDELERWGRKADGEILAFGFFETGRITEGDIHYLIDGGEKIPAADTEFSKDPDFGYRSSDLKEYIQEKTGGRYRKEDVSSISIEDIRAGGPERVAGKLSDISGYGKAVVNSSDYTDLKIFILGLLKAEKAGKRFLFRTAASFVKARAGIPDRDNISGEEIRDITGKDSPRGIIVAGSYVEKTTRQLKQVLDIEEAFPVEFDVFKAADKSKLEKEIKRCTEDLENNIGIAVPVLYTSRRFMTRGKSLPGASSAISDALVRIVSGIRTAPEFIIAKGGITSFDIAVKALGLKRAEVMGQVIDGVPLIVMGAGTRFPGIPYVIFPGNVGDDGALRQVLLKFIESIHR